MGFFDKIKSGLKKTTQAVTQQFEDIMASFVAVDDDLLDELEEAMILSDLGAGVAAKAREEVKTRAQHQKVGTAAELRCLLKDVLTDMMLEDTALDLSGSPAVILVIGVNGVGKTTSIGKLAARYVSEGKRVMLAAADTFRAAAADQLEVWACLLYTSSCTFLTRQRPSSPLSRSTWTTPISRPGMTRERLITSTARFRARSLTPSGTVSYTHLDVYKRQHQYRAAARWRGVSGRRACRHRPRRGAGRPHF